MKAFSIFLTGVGGQGIGLISEIILRAADHAGLPVKSVDTHGLAQRGGIVVSQIRIGDKVFSPLIPTGHADLVISLERHEAFRAAGTTLKDKGCLIYYNTVWQPLSVRLNQTAEVAESDIQDLCRARGIQVISVFHADLPDIRMQNMAVLADIHRHRLIPDIDLKHYQAAMADLMSGAMLAENQELFEKRLIA
ncbi:2-oxoacid:acceptor oxidoreductase family protein [Desulfosarcina sp.]|uniref:2-oxoacid:acceptor oxidoreductase family protein n=1 Tax=Desulfosarcina sp. TaxID=2027861 RepID=UPI003569C0DC